MRSAFLTTLGNLQAINEPIEDTRRAGQQYAFEWPERTSPARTAGRDDDCFATEQVRNLVRQLFLQDLPPMPKQVVFTAVDADTDVGGICMQVAQCLAGQVASSVVLVEADLPLEHTEDNEDEDSFGTACARNGSAHLRNPLHQVSENLWFVPRREFWRKESGRTLPTYTRDRLSELGSSFDYMIVHAPAAGLFGEAALLARLCDGAVLVVEANFTRRVTAQRVKEALQRANVRLFGTVLCGRTFPIPERLYRRL